MPHSHFATVAWCEQTLTRACVTTAPYRVGEYPCSLSHSLLLWRHHPKFWSIFAPHIEQVRTLTKMEFILSWPKEVLALVVDHWFYLVISSGRKDDFVCNSNGLVQLYSVGFCLYSRQLASHRRQTIWQLKLIGYKICINLQVHGSNYCMKWILSLLVEDTWTEKPLTDKMRFGKKNSLLWPSEF